MNQSLLKNFNLIMLEEILGSVLNSIDEYILIVDLYGNILEDLSKKRDVQNISQIFTQENYQAIMGFIQCSINEHKTDKIEILNSNEVRLIKSTPLKYNMAMLSIKDISSNDCTTSLPNRKYFQKKLQASILRTARSEKKGALIFISINNYKTIANSLGHNQVNVYISELSELLVKSLRFDDVVSRYDNKEFAIILEDLDETGDIALAIDKILSTLNKKSIKLDGYEIEINISMGISIFPDDSSSTNEVVKFASNALSYSKSQGLNYMFHTKKISDETDEYFDIEVKLKNSLQNHELYLEYQPQFNIDSEKSSSVEALIRWNSRDLGMIPPDKFIPIAEKNGFIHVLGEWVLQQVCLQIKKWQKNGMKEITVSVNLSRKELQCPKLLTQITKILSKYNVNPELLELEVTESTIIDDPTIAFSNIKKIRAMGIKVSIDDFGTGYSSLSNLREFSLDKLKIDKSFIDNVENDENLSAIIKATIALAKSLNLKVIAEGVETQEQLQFLKDNGCGEIQGFIFSKAVNADEIEKIVKE